MLLSQCTEWNFKRVSFTPFSTLEVILPSLGDKLHISRVTRVPPFRGEYIVSHLKRSNQRWLNH